MTIPNYRLMAQAPAMAEAMREAVDTCETCMVTPAPEYKCKRCRTFLRLLWNAGEL